MRLYMRAKHDFAPNRHGRAAWKGVKSAVRHIQSVSDPLRPWLLHRLGKLELALLVRAEQAPNPDSRVMLSTETDATGLPRPVLDWRLTELDVRSVEGLVRALGAEARRLGLGEVDPAPGWRKPRASGRRTRWSAPTRSAATTTWAPRACPPTHAGA
ncbi:hypothetical protein ACFQU7_19365 [Pseudoroseomonas wenyumeiae]